MKIPEEIPRLYTRSFVFLCAAHLFHALGFWLFVYLPVFLESLGASRSMIGWVMGTAMASSLLLRPTMGAMLDHRGRRPIFILGGCLQILACFLYLTVDRLGPWIFIVRAIHGVGVGTIFSAFLAIASDIVPEQRRAEGFALWGLWGLLPMAIGPKAGDLLIRWQGFSGVLWGAVTMTVTALVLGLFVPDSRQGSLPRLRRHFFRVVGHRPLRMVWAISIVFGLGIVTYFSFVAVYAADRGYQGLNLYFAAYAVAAVGIRFFGARWPDRLGLLPMLKWTLGIYAAGIGMISFSTGPWSFSFAGFLCGLGHGYLFPILNALAVERSEPRERGSAVTAYTASTDLGMFLGAPFMGLISDTWNFETMFRISAFVMVLGGVVFFGLDCRFQDHVRQGSGAKGAR